MSTHTYASEYPQGVVAEEGIKEFLEGFYRLSDTEERHVE